MADLYEIQRGLEWTDANMAEALGISPAMWWKVRHGKREPGLKLLKGATRNFPRVRMAVLAYLEAD